MDAFEFRFKNLTKQELENAIYDLRYFFYENLMELSENNCTKASKISNYDASHIRNTIKKFGLYVNEKTKSDGYLLGSDVLDNYRKNGWNLV